jgi:hypothetical protein
MTITKTTIKDALNAELKKSETITGTEFLRAVRAGLRWLSGQARWSCLHNSKEDYTTSEGDKYIAYPDNFRVLDYIVVNDGNNDSAPLTKISYEKWLKQREDESSADYDEPDSFAKRLRRFYLEPRPDSNGGSNYTIKVWFWRYHPDQATILFGEDFEEVVNNAVIAAYMKQKGRHVKEQYYRALATAEVRRLRPDHEDKKPRRVKYRDMG